MFRPSKMQKFRIIAIKSVVEKLIKKLHELGIVEIEILRDGSVEKATELESFAQISSQLVRIRGIHSLFSKYLKMPKPLYAENSVENANEIKIDAQLKILQTESDQLSNDLDSIKSELDIMKDLRGFDNIDFSKLNTKTLSYFLGEVGRENFQFFRQKLNSSGVKTILEYSLAPNKAIILLLYERSGESSINKIIDDYDCKSIVLPANLSIPSKYRLWLEREKSIKFKRIDQLNREINNIALSNGQAISNLEYSLSIEADRSQISSKFSTTKSCYLLQGWIKKSEFSRLEKEISIFEGVALQATGSNAHESSPIILENPESTTPFQFLTETYSLPNSEELDPTFLYFITVPLLYGMIVGDVIYGILSIILGLYLKSKFSKSKILNSVTKMWIFGAVPSIFFGLIFDEWAGMDHFHLAELLSSWGLNIGIAGSLYSGFSRVHNLPLLLGITLLIGLVHIALGLLLGIISDWNHSKKHAFAKISWLGIEVGGFLAIGGIMFFLFPPVAINIGLAILGLSVVGLILTEGIVGVLEIPGLSGNVVSYSRIAVVGLVGVIIAEIINQFFVPQPSQGFMAILFFLIFMLLHTVNAFIAMFEALIQGGRLNILEFRSKFMKGGGRLFDPFSMRD